MGNELAPTPEWGQWSNKTLEQRTFRGPRPIHSDRRNGRGVQDPLLALHAAIGNRAIQSLTQEPRNGLHSVPVRSAGADPALAAAERESAASPAAREQSATQATAPSPARWSAPGAPLDKHLRSYFEPRLGRDLSRVRIHTGTEAALATRALQAKAFVRDSDIAFAPGAYSPGTRQGSWLLAHELAHTAQPIATRLSRHDGGVSSADSAAEGEARQAASALVQGRPARVFEARHSGSVQRFGEPENVPDQTYITTQGAPGFLNEATEYHTAWGLSPRRISSVEGILADLASATPRLSRVRIVMHAAALGIFSSLFANEPRLSLQGDRLSAYATSDMAGLDADLGTPITLSSSTLDSIVDDVRSRNPGVLQPFGLNQSGSPTGALAQLVNWSAQRFFLHGAVNHQNAAAIQVMLASLDSLLADAAARLTVPAPTPAPPLSTPGAPQAATPAVPAAPTPAQVASLRTELQRSCANLHLHVQGSFTPNANQTRQLRQANRAIAGGFRATLNAARARFDSDSWIDIRGCNVGTESGYLESMARFFGAPGALPHVSGPNWFQMFRVLGFQTLPNHAAIDGALAAPEFAAALDNWLDLTGTRGRMNLLRAFYQNEIARRQLDSEQSAPAVPRGILLRLRPPVLPPPTWLRPLPASDRATIGLLTSMQRNLTLQPLATFPSLLGGASPPPARLLPNLHLTDPLIGIAQVALDRLNATNAEAHFFFDSPLVLPVRLPSAEIRLVMLNGLRQEAIGNWVDSQWRSAPPALQALRDATAISNNQRRVQALVESHEADSDMVFPPDPRYWAHIRSV